METSANPTETMKGHDHRGCCRTWGIQPGLLSPGRYNAITDVEGVRVGHVTRIEGDDIRTGATTILPHPGNLFQDRVPAGVDVANGFGKMMGVTQIQELGEIETPIVLTNTFSIPQAAAAILDWTLAQPGNEDAKSINPVVGETNDSTLNAIQRRVLTSGDVLEAIATATGGPVSQGCVGAGTGTTAFGWKAGIGTSSRRLPQSLGGFTLGVLVQSNFAGVLQVLGAPVGQSLGRHYLAGEIDTPEEKGSIMIVIATDAPLSDRNLTRVARRAFAGLARTGSSFTHGSGDYAIAFSTAESVRRSPDRRTGLVQKHELANTAMSPLFQATIEATEEAIYNSLFAANTMTGRNGITVEALPIDRAMALLREHTKRGESQVA